MFRQIFSKKYNYRLKISSTNGFHLRPVAKFVAKAKEYKCDIKLKHNNKIANGKNINEILSLSLEYNDEFEIITQGKQSKAALTHLIDTFEDIMQQDKPATSLQKIKTKNKYETSSVNITPLYEGVAIAPIYHLQTKQTKQNSSLTLTDAINKVKQSLQNKDNEIFQAQLALLESIDSNIDTVEKLEEFIQNQISNLSGMMKAKAIDYQDILHQIKSLLGEDTQIILPDSEAILLAKDLLPSQIKQLVNSTIKGVILQQASITSHSAILLKSYGIISAIANVNIDKHTPVILDTIDANLIINPTKNDNTIASTFQKQHLQKQMLIQNNKTKDAITKDNRYIKVYANITDVNSARQAKEQGATGVGLLRSEFMFDSQLPTLQTQIQTYQQIFELFDDITVRTLDVGGDKNLPFIDIPKEHNPFLGIRGIRLLKIVPQILQTQLLAIYKASENKPIKIMFPMITTTSEFIEAKEFAIEVANKHNIDISHIKFGMMIETPIVLFDLNKFDKLVDFYSIGSNDLAQYSYAIERGHPTLSVDESDEAFINMLRFIYQNRTKDISICGEIASNKKVIKKLIDIGYDKLSVSVANIATIKQEIRDV
jgi:phosphocarrier protein FPr